MDSWDFLPVEDASPLEVAAAEKARWPAEIAAMHVIVPGAPIFAEPAEADGFVVRFFADEDTGVVPSTDDHEEDLWELLERHTIS